MTLYQKPVVTLIDYTKNAFNLSIASARTCYSAKGILFPDDMEKSEKSVEIRDAVAKSTKKAGHLTTRQHPQFIFAVDKVSRQFVWSFLHSHPYYNSEQVSQRYVEVNTDNMYVPESLSGKLLEDYLAAIHFATKAYSDFIEILKPFVEKEYFAIYKSRAHYPDKWQSPIKKRCLEVARYFLPLATHTYLYHTINGLTLHRYHRLVNKYDVPEEQRIVVQQMIAAVKDVDPLFIDEMEDPLPLEETIEFQFFKEHLNEAESKTLTEEFINEFDAELNGSYSKMVAYSVNADKILADSVRAVAGISRSQLNDTDAVNQVLSPATNHHLGSTLNETTMSPITRALFNVNYTFKKRISHTADSQDQRHRMVPASRPVLFRHFTGKPDFITPAIVEKYPELKAKYAETMEKIFANINAFLANGGSDEYSLYLYPNAFPIRFYESGDLLNLHHKFKARTCFNAQEEIFSASVDEIKGIQEVHPEIGKWLRPPCWMRFKADIKPVCPEGDKFCGVQVWKKEIEDYARII